MPAKIIVLTTPKGGAGKTTVALNLAASLPDSILVDTDPSQSAMKWADAAEVPLPFAISGYNGQRVVDALRGFRDKFQWIVVDTPPSALSISGNTRGALIAADLAIVPVVPSPIDIREAVAIKPLLDEVSQMREAADVPALKARLVVNRLKSGTTFGAEIADALSEVGIPMLASMLKEREVHKHAALYGVSVHQIPRAKAAAEEVTQLADEIRRIVRQSD